MTYFKVTVNLKYEYHSPVYLSQAEAQGECDRLRSHPPISFWSNPGPVHPEVLAFDSAHQCVLFGSELLNHRSSLDIKRRRLAVVTQ